MKAFPDFIRLQMLKQNGLSELQKETISMQSSGMDLRDYFAAKAMQLYVGNGNVNKEDVARISYEYADAMMKARKK